MGFKLRREVRDHLPPGLLTANERCVVLELADYCNDETRAGKPGVEWLAQKADVPVGKVGEILARVGKKWIELRVALGVGRDGRPYYSKPGMNTEYRFPPLAALKVPQNGGPQAPESRPPKAPRSGGPKAPEDGGPPSTVRPPKTGDPSPQFPQRDPSSLSSDDERDDANTPPQKLSLARQVLVAAGADPAEAERLIPVIEQLSKVRTPTAWWRAVAAAGDGPTVLAAGRRASANTGRAPASSTFEPYRNAADEDYLNWVNGPHHHEEPAA